MVTAFVFAMVGSILLVTLTPEACSTRRGAASTDQSTAPSLRSIASRCTSPPPSAPPPLLDEPQDPGLPPRLITVFLRPSGDSDRDRRRIKNVYGILISSHG